MHLDDPNVHRPEVACWFEDRRAERLKRIKEREATPLQSDVVRRQTQADTPERFKLAAQRFTFIQVAAASAIDPLSALTLDQDKLIRGLRPLGADGGVSLYQHFNADGYVSGSLTDEPRVVLGYAQLFRNGVIEYVDTNFLHFDRDGKRLLHPGIEYLIAETVQDAAKLLAALGAEGPFLTAVSYIGVKNYLMGGRGLTHQVFDIQSDDLSPPPVSFDAPGAAQTALRPIFDAMWQAAGRPRSLNYDEQGQWTGNAQGIG